LPEVFKKGEGLEIIFADGAAEAVPDALEDAGEFAEGDLLWGV